MDCVWGLVWFCSVVVCVVIWFVDWLCVVGGVCVLIIMLYCLNAASYGLGRVALCLGCGFGVWCLLLRCGAVCDSCGSFSIVLVRLGLLGSFMFCVIVGC